MGLAAAASALSFRLGDPFCYGRAAARKGIGRDLSLGEAEAEAYGFVSIHFIPLVS